MSKGEKMRYIFLGLLVMIFSGCGGSNNSENEETKEVERPVSPTPKERSKQPPSIPNLD
jgi:PBP1b-binding outer membrane lipoprotein LpoB